MISLFMASIHLSHSAGSDTAWGKKRIGGISMRFKLTKKGVLVIAENRVMMILLKSVSPNMFHEFLDERSSMSMLPESLNYRLPATISLRSTRRDDINLRSLSPRFYRARFLLSGLVNVISSNISL
ncbi:hypothetical protein DRO64_02080 [Candidatus Bathyarchaeota archaeon]|nr:MAG: hypothetical protein DRO64_02080 [Candidatus Bathyarchaeota archaeon]